MAEQSPPIPQPRILLFDEYGNPLIIRMPFQRKPPIGFINGVRFDKADILVSDTGIKTD